MKILSLLVIASLFVFSSCVSLKSADKMEGSGAINLRKKQQTKRTDTLRKIRFMLAELLTKLGPQWNVSF